MGVLQHIVLTMQSNKEILPEYASILLELIKEEDGLVCEAYNQIEVDECHIFSFVENWRY